MKRVSLLFLLMVLISSLFANDLLKSKAQSPYTYYYQISNKEAAKLYKGKTVKDYYKLLHTKVDSFLTSKFDTTNLKPGHYLLTKVSDNQVRLELKTIQDFYPYVMNNGEDLSIKVLDKFGNNISKAKVKVGCNRVYYNNETQTYLHRKSKLDGDITIEYGGLILIQEIYPESVYRRKDKKITWDNIRRKTRWRLQRYAYKWERMIDYFEDIEYYNQRNFQRKWSTYIITNKPKYKPNDTVYFKAWIMKKKNGKLLNDSVDVIFDCTTEKKLFTLAPYRKGAYEGSFVLHDSLDLTLDKRCYLEITKKDDNISRYLKTSFYYEDYELKSTNLKLRTESKKQFKGDTLALYVKGTDENDLNLLNARLNVKVLLEKPSYRNQIVPFDKQIFIPDTAIFDLEVALDPSKETKIMIPWEIFPKANLKYKIDVEMLTADNERKFSSEKIEYIYKETSVKETLNGDSISFDYLVEEKSTPAFANLKAMDGEGNVLEIIEGEMPLRLIVNQYVAKFRFKVGEEAYDISMDDVSPEINIKNERNDSCITFSSENPSNIKFNYFVYRQNKLIEKGVTTQLDYVRKRRLKNNYFLSIQYLWAGEVKEENFDLPYMKDDALKLEVSQPTIVFPGQKVSVDVTATKKRKPVKNLDITAYALTSKFDPKLPRYPKYSKYYKNRQKKYKYRFEKLNAQHQKINIDSVLKRLFADLDTVEYYKFLFPENGMYKTTIDASDSFTQFAPFVVDNGQLQPIHIIYVDNRLVYTSLIDSSQPYSFLANGRHTVTLRLSDCLLEIDSVFFEPYKKNIFSFEKSKYIESKDLTSELTFMEQNSVLDFMMPIKRNMAGGYNFIQQGGKTYWLKDVNYSYQNKEPYFVGPVSKKSDVKFVKGNGEKISFRHEPFYEYDFVGDNVIKMRSIDMVKKYPVWNKDNTGADLKDMLVTEDSIRKYNTEIKRETLNDRRRNNSRYTQAKEKKAYQTNIKLSLEFKHNGHYTRPLNYLLMKPQDSVVTDVLSANTKLIKDIVPGDYMLYALFEDDSYCIIDSIQAQKNVTTYIKAEFDELNMPNKRSRAYNKLLEYFYKGSPSYDDPSKYEMIKLNGLVNKNKYLEKVLSDINEGKTVNLDSVDTKSHVSVSDDIYVDVIYRGGGYTVSGVVIDNTGEAAIGATVKIEGTTIGTITDFNGAYTINNVPYNAKELEVSYIGFASRVVPISSTVINVELKEDKNALEAVVVTGYGETKKRDLVTSVASVSVSSAADEFVEYNSPNVNIRVRGGSSLTQSEAPLYVVDGVIVKSINKIPPSEIVSMDVLKDASATAIYGAKGANGVIVITTKNGSNTMSNNGADMNADFLEASMSNSSMRSNFSDYAYWQPRLKTDKYGKASFEVTYPDDVTKWKSYILAIKGKGISASYEEEVKSYKPLMAKVLLPRFLVQGDSANVFGSVSNYLPDTVAVSTTFSINDSVKSMKQVNVVASHIDTQLVVANTTDSISVQYKMEREGGYFDGEERNISVFKVGLEETTGTFAVLDKDTSFSVKLGEGETTVYMSSNAIDVLDKEMDHLIRYQYLCNEQMASKLKAYLAKERLCKYLHKEFEYKKDVKKLIQKLQENQNISGEWGWWNQSESVDWISTHVLSALVDAKEMGYDVNFIKLQDYVRKQMMNLEDCNNPKQMLNIIENISLISAKVNYAEYFAVIDSLLKIRGTDKKPVFVFNTNEKFKEIRLKQKNGVAYTLDSLKAHQYQTIFGSKYYGDKKEKISFRRSIYNNNVSNTLLAYEILKRSSSYTENDLMKVRNWFYETRGVDGWTNTYESSKIIDALLPDLIKEGKSMNAQVNVSGAYEITVTKFPFETKLKGGSLNINKSGVAPVFFTAYQHSWNENPKSKTSDFVINTAFEKATNVLKAGEPVEMGVSLKVDKYAEYVQIQIPIPAGCSYDSKRQNYFGYEIHREFFKDKVIIYCKRLPEGEYKFKIDLLPRFTGTYVLNPAKVELMYFPTFNANEEMKKVQIR